VNSLKIMRWMIIWLVSPIAAATLLALPIHLTVTNTDVWVGRYGLVRSEQFQFAAVRRATLIDGYRLRDGSFHAARDLVMDFADGRRLRGNQVGDGGTAIRPDILNALIAGCRCNPGHATTEAEIPSLPIGY
jgi:hypothetical protein